MESADFEFIRIYATMLIKLGINLSRGKDLINSFKQRYDNLLSQTLLTSRTQASARDKNQLHSSRNSQNTLETVERIVERKVCYATVSGNRDTIGIVLGASKEIYQLLGYTTSDLAG